MALTTLSATLSAAFNYQATLAKTGLSAAANNTNIGKSNKFSLGTGALQGQEIYATLITIAASGNTDIDLTNISDVLGQSISLTAVKGFYVWLLSTSDSAPDGTAGTACSSITVGNAASNAFQGPLSASATYTITNGGDWLAKRPDSTGWAVSGTVKDIHIINNDSSNSAKIMVAVIGE